MKQRGQVTSADTDVFRNIMHLDAARVICLNVFHGRLHVIVLLVHLKSTVFYEHAVCDAGEKGVHLRLHQKLLHDLQQLGAAAGGKGGNPIGQTDFPHELSRPRSLESNPQIGPGLLCVRLIKCHDIRLDQKALLSFQMVGSRTDAICAPSVQHIVQNVIRTDGRTEAVSRFTDGIAAVTQGQLLRILFLPLKCFNPRFFHAKSPFAAFFFILT